MRRLQKNFDIDYMDTDSGEYRPCKDLFSEIYYHKLIKQLILTIINALPSPPPPPTKKHARRVRPSLMS